MRTFSRNQLISFSKYGLHSQIGYANILSYDSIHEEYLIVDQYDDVHRRKSSDLRHLTKKIKLQGMNATVYRVSRGAFLGMFRAEVHEGEIVDTELFKDRVSLVLLRGTPAYHAYLVRYIYPDVTLDITPDDPRHHF